MTLYLSNDDVSQLLTMDAAIDVLDDLFRQEAAGLVENIPRKRRRFEGGGSGTLMGGVVHGSKAYAVRNSHQSLLHDTDTGKLQAIIEPSAVAWIRTGAASGVATKYMASPDASVVGCIGTARQAITQLQAICAVRPVTLIKVYSRSQERRAAFAAQMIQDLGIDVQAVDTPEACLADSPIVVTITNSRTPVFDGALIAPGTHINAAGGNSYARCEVDDTTITRSSVIAVDNMDQAKVECGELIAAADRGVFRWGQAVELHQVVSGQTHGRANPNDITLFESQGIGTEDTACYAYVLRQARELGLGTELPF